MKLQKDEYQHDPRPREPVISPVERKQYWFDTVNRYEKIIPYF